MKTGIFLGLFLIIVAALLPTAFNMVTNGTCITQGSSSCATTAPWDGTITDTLWLLIPVGGVVAVLLYLFR